MNAADKARLFDALYGTDQTVDPETRKQAVRRVLLSEDGLTLIKTFSPCLRGRVNAENSHALAYAEGRRSVLLDLVRIATNNNDGG
jgi:hypothetical protein